MNQSIIAKSLVAVVVLGGAITDGADEFVNRADANGDGFVSLYELRAAHYADPEFNKRIEQSFNLYDRDGDGRISDEERRATIRALQEVGAELPSGRLSATAEPLEEVTPLALQRGGAARQPAPAVSDETSVESSSAFGTADATVRTNTESWIRDIDSDGSGGASMNELLAGGNDQRWFSDGEFDAADRDGDGDLSADELAALVRSIERRRR